MSTTNSYTLEDWIRTFRSEPNTVDTLMLKWGITDKDAAVFFMDETLLSQYYDELTPYITSRAWSQVESHLYAYNPRLFSQELYGMPELWYLVLYANEMHSAMEFHDLKTVKYFSRDVLKIMNVIMLKEQGRLDENASEVTDLVVNGKTTNQDINITVV